jgi:hypothetical protein
MLFHQVDNLFDRCLLRDCYYLSSHHIFDPAAMGMNILICNPPGTQQKLQPARTPWLSTGFVVAKKIAFRNKPHMVPLRINDR